MIKKLIALIIFTIAFVFALPYVQQAVELLLRGHEWISQMLGEVFAGGHTGSIIKGIIALLCIPVAIALIPSVIFWFIRRYWFPYFMDIVWIVWLIQAGALAVVQNIPAATV
jgi:hypothetical protein